MASSSLPQVLSPCFFPSPFEYEHFSPFWTKEAKNFYCRARLWTRYGPLLQLIRAPYFIPPPCRVLPPRVVPQHKGPRLTYGAPTCRRSMLPSARFSPCCSFRKISPFSSGFTSTSLLAFRPSDDRHSPWAVVPADVGPAAEQLSRCFTTPRSCTETEHLNSKLSNWTHIRIAADSVTKQKSYFSNPCGQCKKQWWRNGYFSSICLQWSSLNLNIKLKRPM